MELFLTRYEEVLLQSAFFGSLLVAAALEMFWPRRPETASLAYRWANNIGLSIINQSVMFVVGALVVAYLISENDSSGVFTGGAELSFWPAVLAAFLIFELVSYFLHRAFHTVPWLWRIHRVHHSDTEIDFTTANRGHPLEALVLLPLTAPLIAWLGLPVAAVILYLLVRVMIVIFAHCNLYLPPKVDRILSYLIVTPDYHRVHHCSDQAFTDSNYAIAFTWVDRLFGTYRHKPFEEQTQMEIGLAEFRHKRDSRLDRLLAMPFLR